MLNVLYNLYKNMERFDSSHDSHQNVKIDMFSNEPKFRKEWLVSKLTVGH